MERSLLPGSSNAVRADQTINLPVVMTREAVAVMISRMGGTAHVVATLLYGSGWRIMETVRLRGVARSTSPMHWLGNTPLSPRHGAG